ncbi:DsbA family oxidoreductase [Neotabrizicola shimadae]|uniref:DsbA family oxidoreductase n=1 Tax=Neotabrizicola shimadae TaxID=2807096 RepID=A0A8G1ED26_9RHOB|nr:DsbA family oxidoreductase [Neotabrizicola shimadae]QYZ71082.1 DsbA family oxidoreductase [Neotabrizicola shimadae]
MVRLDVFADPVCPWCFVGKAGLDRALEARPGHPFTVEWHPFQLNPDTPREGVDKRSWLEARFGGKAQVDAVHDRLREVARKAGVDLDPDVPKRIPNTLDAHRLIHWAGLEGRQSAAVGTLFRAYWREGRDIGNPAVLADIGAAIGMDRAAVVRLLASDADVDETLAREDHARQRGVRAVPTFVIADRHVVSGAQPHDLWQQVIDDLVAQSASRG